MSDKFEIDGYSADELLIGVALQRYAVQVQNRECPSFGVGPEAIAKQQEWLKDNPPENYYDIALGQMKLNADHLRQLIRKLPNEG